MKNGKKRQTQSSNDTTRSFAELMRNVRAAREGATKPPRPALFTQDQRSQTDREHNFQKSAEPTPERRPGTRPPVNLAKIRREITRAKEKARDE